MFWSFAASFAALSSNWNVSPSNQSLPVISFVTARFAAPSRVPDVGVYAFVNVNISLVLLSAAERVPSSFNTTSTTTCLGSVSWLTLGASGLLSVTLNVYLPLSLNTISPKCSVLSTDLFVIVMLVAASSVPKITFVPTAAFVASSPASNVNINSSEGNQSLPVNFLVTFKYAWPDKVASPGLYIFVNTRLFFSPSTVADVVSALILDVTSKFPFPKSTAFTVRILFTLSPCTPGSNPAVFSETLNVYVPGYVISISPNAALWFVVVLLIITWSFKSLTCPSLIASDVASSFAARLNSKLSFSVHELFSSRPVKIFSTSRVVLPSTFPDILYSFTNTPFFTSPVNSGVATSFPSSSTTVYLISISETLLVTPSGRILVSSVIVNT